MRSPLHSCRLTSLFQNNPEAQIRLFCFPHAGSGAARYLSWKRHLPSEVELCPVQLPGRENRMQERAHSSMPHVLEELVSELSPFLDMPYVLFGHSMGGLISFEFARQIASSGKRDPELLMISACPAAHLPRRLPDIGHLPDPEFLNQLQNRYQAFPREVLEQIDSFLPLLRADVNVCETYVSPGKRALRCPIECFGGTRDSTVNRMEIEGWSDQTVSHCQSFLFDGDHFFIHSHQSDVVVQISASLARLLDDGFQ